MTTRPALTGARSRLEAPLTARPALTGARSRLEAPTPPHLEAHLTPAPGLLSPPREAEPRRPTRTHRHCHLGASLLLLVLLVHSAAPQLTSRADTVLALLSLLVVWASTLYALFTQSGLTWALARWIAVPLGLPLTAYQLGRRAACWRHDPDGGGALLALLALHRRPEREPAIAERLDAWLNEGPLKAAGLVANGLRYALHGERELARSLLQTALTAEADRPATLAATFAADWLCADAADRGAWSELIELGERPLPFSRGAAFLIAVARRLLGRGAPSPTDAGLRLAWWLAPRHHLTRPLLDRALAQPRVLHRPPPPPAPPAPPAPPPDAPLPTEPLPRALAQHARLVQTTPLSLRLHPAPLHDTCRAWDELHRSGQVHRFTAERALHLGIHGRAEAIQDAFFAEIAEDLAELSERAGVPLLPAHTTADTHPDPNPNSHTNPDHNTPQSDPTRANHSPPGAVTQRAAALLRRRLLDQLEAAIEALDACAARPKLPPLDAWREWERLRQLHQRAAALGGLELRQLIFPGLHRSACNFAVWLWNERKEHAIAAPIFRWLLLEAEHVGDEAAIELQRKNVAVKAT